MSRATLNQPVASRPQWSAYLELLKPITWFPPMWAFACGLVASGAALGDRWLFVVGGVLLTGPLVCGTSQIVNDWFDRHVDAINEPHRPIPSGRIPGRWGLYFAIAWSLLSLLLATQFGSWVLAVSVVGLLLAWAYSAPPVRLKQNGWWGNAASGLCYEGFAWFTAVAAMTGAVPSTVNLIVLLLYSVGAHGIMTLNDFKAIEGDREMGINSLPVLLGPERAARFACVTMLVPQAMVVFVLWLLHLQAFAAAVAAITIAQAWLMPRLLSDPMKHAPWYNATGILLYVIGMLVTAFALRSLVG